MRADQAIISESEMMTMIMMITTGEKFPYKDKAPDRRNHVESVID
jgi:hypothetical protein